jgi:hypothetical protein
MTLGQQLNHRPDDYLRHWQRRTRVVARKAAQRDTSHYQRIWAALLVSLAVLLGLLASMLMRGWLWTAFANVAIVGGIVAAPIISVIAWVGVALPAHAPLHEAAPTLFIGSMLWLAMGILSAHARRDDPRIH